MLPDRIQWLDEAKADVRRLDRTTAMRIFDGILQYARTGGGDVAPLQLKARTSQTSWPPDGPIGRVVSIVLCNRVLFG